MNSFDLFSDAHLDMRREPMRMLMDIEPQSAVLVVAGDLCESRNISQDWISVLCDKYELVLYVPGNHEFYGSTKEQTLDQLLAVMKHNSFVLYDGSILYDGLTLAGSTLWFPDSPTNRWHEKHLSDFTYIQDFRSWVYVDHEESKRYLVGSGCDIWVTHHLPLWRSVHPKYEGSKLNCFFVGDMANELQGMQDPPRVIVHGHTHEECDYMAGNTRIVCNPLGYPHEGRRSIIPVKVAL